MKLFCWVDQGAEGEDLLPFSFWEKTDALALPGSSTYGPDSRLRLGAESVKQKATLEQEIKRLDLAHADAILRGDLAALDKLWTEDFKVNNPFNQIDRADRIRTGAVTYSSFIREPETVLIHGDTVIVMGREIVVPKGDSTDAGKTINRRYTNIWMKRSGKWRLVARHASVICPK